MSLVKTWYTPEEAESMFGLTKPQLTAWIEEGLVRFEREKDKVVRVNIDDIRLQIELLVRDQP
jgi:hypothetical protein